MPLERIPLTFQGFSTVELLDMAHYFLPNESLMKAIQKRLKDEPWRKDSFLPYLIKCQEHLAQQEAIRNRKPFV